MERFWLQCSSCSSGVTRTLKVVKSELAALHRSCCVRVCVFVMCVSSEHTRQQEHSRASQSPLYRTGLAFRLPFTGTILEKRIIAVRMFLPKLWMNTGLQCFHSHPPFSFLIVSSFTFRSRSPVILIQASFSCQSCWLAGVAWMLSAWVDGGSCPLTDSFCMCVFSSGGQDVPAAGQ